ncbi:hypothetical protein [Pseudarthrobacter sp. N5]|uniref:hypothetical protein n=1 Tax=Pseudarthrobacter sp. N5 TaxID=3418416 RepID=UPI003CEEE0D1
MTLPNADYRFPPIVKPIEYELRRIEAAALMLEVPCIHCNATTEAIAGSGSLPRVLGLTHEVGCPDENPED